MSSAAAASAPPPAVLREHIKSVTRSLWDSDLNNVPTCISCKKENIIGDDGIDNVQLVEGEAVFRHQNDDDDVDVNNQQRLYEQDFSNRSTQFYNEAMKGCPKAQHSYGLILWNGFDTGHSQKDTTQKKKNTTQRQNSKESAKFHAAAAYQNHLDSIAILGGCLRKGLGVKKKQVELGVQLIEFSAQEGNPTGINKKAALLEELESDEISAYKLYKASYENDNINALLLFNLGWYYMNGLGMDAKDEGLGVDLWRKAANMAPDEGSEESAWFLYEYYKRDEPKSAEKWLRLAANLGYPEAVDEYDQLKAIFGGDYY